MTINTQNSDQLLKLIPPLGHQVKSIIKPMEQVGITGVFYHRIYSDGSSINLTNKEEWTGFYIEKLAQDKYSQEDILDQCFTHPMIDLWALHPDNKVWNDGRYYFDCANGVTLTTDYPEYRERVGFFSTADNHEINHFYTNEVTSLKALKNYFLIEANKLIETAEGVRNKCLTPFYLQHIKAKNKQKNYKQNTKPSINLKEQSLLITNKKTHLPMYLSPQRSKCLFLLAEGSSAKEIARKMQLSPKTVEHYLAILREELGCKSSKELIAVYGEQLKN